jgi:hypothetical protein
MFVGRYLLIVVLLSLSWARPAPAGDVFESTWKASDIEPVNFTGKKIAALVIAKSRAARAAAEDLLADQITARGGEGIAGHSLVSESDLDNRDTVKAKLQEAGVAGAVVMRAALAGGRHPDEKMWESPEYRRFMGFSSESAEFGEKKAKFYVEVMVYSLEQDKLIWAGKSATKASTVDELINNMANAVAERLNQEGLIRKNQE